MSRHPSDLTASLGLALCLLFLAGGSPRVEADRAGRTAAGSELGRPDLGPSELAAAPAPQGGVPALPRAPQEAEGFDDDLGVAAGTRYPAPPPRRAVPASRCRRPRPPSTLYLHHQALLC